MNDDIRTYPEVRTYNGFWPIVLLALSWGIVLTWQIVNIAQQRTAVQQSRDQLETNFTQSSPQHEQLIAQSRAVQGKLETLVTDLLNLAKSGDADARAIIEKYKIQQNAPAGAAAPAASPAASP